MTFTKFLEIASAFLRIGTVKSSNAKDAAGNTQAGESGIAASAQNVCEIPHSSGVLWMTEKEAKTRIVDWCKSQVGYHEGYDGTNKYADGQWDTKLYGFSALQVPWCDVFVDAAYISVFGFEDATAMTYQQPAGFAACSLSADAYRRNGAFYQTPEVGDQIFFFYGGAINHTGIVIDVQGDTVICVEGNYSDGVARTQYKRDNQIIAGYGRPNWAVVAEPETVGTPIVFEEEIEPQFDIIHPDHRRAFMHLQYGDGVGCPLPQVKAWQNLLLCWGIDLGEAGADGEYGLKTETATKKWQQEAQEIGAIVEVNGIVDEDDWMEIIEVLT